MTTGMTTTTQVDNATGMFYDRVLIERLLPNLVHDLFGEKRNIPAGAGTTIKFRSYTTLGTAKTPLTEGQDPPSTQLAKTDITALVKQFGGFIQITDWVDLTTEDAVITEAMILNGEQLGETLDSLMKDVLVATASQTNMTGGSNGATPTQPHKTGIDGVVLTLLNAKNKFITSIVNAATGQGTTPVRPSFWGICHTDLIDDLELVSGFQHHSKYPQQGPVLMSEWGSTGNVRWVQSPNADKDTSPSPDVYDMLIIAKNAYASTTIAGATVKSIVKGFSDAGSKLDLYMTAGWKAAWAGRILNDNSIHRLSATNGTSATG